MFSQELQVLEELRYYENKWAVSCFYIEIGCSNSPPPTFPLGAVVDRGLLAVLQGRVRQGVVRGGSAQQLLGTAAAVHAVLTAVGGSDGLGGASQTPPLPAERTPGGAGSLADRTARDHWIVLAEAEWGEK